MIAGAGPMPPTPSAASPGSAAASADSGTISSPNSAIDGIVCNRLSTAKSGPCRRGRRAAATPSGKPITSAGPTDPATSATWRSQRLGEELMPGRVFAGDRQLVESPGQRQCRDRRRRSRRRPSSRSAGPARSALQRVDDGERRAGGDDPERRPERDPRRRAGGGGDGMRRLARRGQRREQQTGRASAAAPHAAACAAATARQPAAARPMTAIAIVGAGAGGGQQPDRPAGDQPVRRQCRQTPRPPPQPPRRRPGPAAPGCARRSAGRGPGAGSRDRPATVTAANAAISDRQRRPLAASSPSTAIAALSCCNVARVRLAKTGSSRPAICGYCCSTASRTTGAGA